MTTIEQIVAETHRQMHMRGLSIAQTEYITVELQKELEGLIEGMAMAVLAQGHGLNSSEEELAILLDSAQIIRSYNQK